MLEFKEVIGYFSKRTWRKPQSIRSRFNCLNALSSVKCEIIGGTSGEGKTHIKGRQTNK